MLARDTVTGREVDIETWNYQECLIDGVKHSVDSVEEMFRRGVLEIDRDHFHVNVFLPGCLNDGGSGPYDTYESALEELEYSIESILNDIPEDEPEDSDIYDFPVETETGRYEVGYYIHKVEPCREYECLIRDN